MSLKVPGKRDHLQLPNGDPTERDALFQTLLIHISRRPQKTRSPDKTKSHLHPKVPGSGAPPLHGPPQRGPYGERYSVSKTSGLFVHLYPSESPVKELSHENRVKDTVTVHGTPRGRKVYMQWGAARFPKGIVNDTAVTTPVPCSFRHVTFHLGLGRPEPS